MNLALLANLKKTTYALIAIGSAFIIFDVNFYLLVNLPGNINNACVDQGNLTLTNLIFSSIISILMGTIISGIIRLGQMRAQSKAIQLSGMTSIGFILSALTLFCSICSLPILSLIGLSAFAQFFTDYNDSTKIVSLILLLTSAYLLNQQLIKQKNR